jgi:energy-coupling factor transport system permease protein
VSVARLHIGLGAALDWLRATTFAIDVILAALLLSWTTPHAEVTPALHWLGRPLRAFRLPIDQWAIATSLGLRALPLLLDETRILMASTRMRAAHAPRRTTTPRSAARRRVIDAQDLLAAITITASRRAREFADAMEARGGAVRAAPDRPSVSMLDVVVLAGVVATLAIGVAL